MQYISLDEVLNITRIRCTRHCSGDCDTCIIRDVLMGIGGIRPIRIIRCADCIHYEPLKGRDHWGYCRCNKVDVRSDEFCACGVEIDGEGEDNG